MRVVATLADLILAFPAEAGEETIALADGAGRAVIEANCGACHSLDYIEMNSPFLDRQKWEATVTKMIERFGAPIEAANVPTIVEYLTANYGP